MPHTNESTNNYFISNSGTEGIWSIPYTFLFVFVIGAIWGIGQVIGMAIGAYFHPDFDSLYNIFTSGDPEVLDAIAFDGEIISPTALVGAIVGMLGVVWVILLKKGISVKEYLGLRTPKAKDMLIWLGIMVAFLFCFEYAARNIEGLESEFMTRIMESTTRPWLLILSIGIIAPIFEEFVFRGFLYKGIAHSSLGPHAAVWISSVLFALIHVQYNMAIMLLIIPMALVMGYSRMYSRSLYVPIALHILNNTLTTVLALSELDMI